MRTRKQKLVADNVLDFSAARSAKTGKSTAPTTKRKNSSVARIVTNQDVWQEVWEHVIQSWQEHATKNRLAGYIESKIPSYARGADKADYLNDLNVISSVEQKLNMKVTMCYPTVTQSNPDNWIVGFHRGTEVFSSSPDLVSEANTRALNILLYLSFEFKMKKLKRT